MFILRLFLPEQPKPPEAQFEEIYGFSPKNAEPEKVIDMINHVFDELKTLQHHGFLAQGGAERARHHLGNAGVSDWNSYFNAQMQWKNLLDEYVKSAQPFVVEDLGFYNIYAQSVMGVADVRTMLQLWETAGKSQPGYLTEEQKDVLQGKITLKGV